MLIPSACVHFSNPLTHAIFQAAFHDRRLAGCLSHGETVMKNNKQTVCPERHCLCVPIIILDALHLIYVRNYFKNLHLGSIFSKKRKRHQLFCRCLNLSQLPDLLFCIIKEILKVIFIRGLIFYCFFNPFIRRIKAFIISLWQNCF